MEPALGKQFKAQNLIQFYQLWADSPYLQHHQFIKAIMEMFDFHDTDKYIKSPEQLQAEQQQQTEAQVQQELMSAGLQDSLSSKQAERELTRDVVKGIMK
jgi:hypothetical protein